MVSIRTEIEGAWEQLIEQGYAAHCRRNYKRAESAYNLALLMAANCTEIDPASATRLRCVLANLYCEMNQHALAEETIRKVLADGDSHISENDKAVLLRDLSECCRAQGKFREAILCSKGARQLLRFQRRQLQRIFDNPDCALIKRRNHARSLPQLMKLNALIEFLWSMLSLILLLNTGLF